MMSFVGRDVIPPNQGLAGAIPISNDQGGRIKVKPPAVKRKGEFIDDYQ